MSEEADKRTAFFGSLSRRIKLRLSVNRIEIFSESFQASKLEDGRIFLDKRFCIKFIGENGIDYGGLTRDWFTELFKIIFNTDFGLFKVSESNQNVFHPNELSSEFSENYLEHFKFAGLMVGVATCYPFPIGFHFADFFLKLLIDKPVKLHDLKEFDEGLYNYLCWLMDNNISEVEDEFFFVYEYDAFGEHRTVELVHDGSKISLDDKNKFHYINLIINYILGIRIVPQINAFISGFNFAVPQERISDFTISELDRLISGITIIDVDDWERNTWYNNGYTSNSKQIIWFWRFLRTLDQPLLRKVLQLTTGSPTVPFEGFKALKGNGRGGRKLFEIVRSAGSSTHLPIFKTCFNVIVIPPYNYYKELQNKFMIAITEGSEYFAFC